MDLVLDIGNYRIKGAFFKEKKLENAFVIPPDMEMLRKQLSGFSFESTLISSVHKKYSEDVKNLFASLNIPFHLLDFSTLHVKLDVDEPEQLGHDRIANVYGALVHFPQNDCIVVDMGTTVTFDYIASDGRYVGGAIYPGVDISAKALASYTNALPEVAIEKPETPVAKTTKTHIQSGLYWGLLGAIERIVSEMRQTAPSPSSVKVIATGGYLRTLSPEQFTADLNDLVDLIDPYLTLIGLYEILKEKKEK